MSDKRKYSRIPFKHEVNVIFEQNKFNAKLLDISLNGMLVSSSDTIPIKANSNYTIELTLGNNSINLSMEALLLHQENDEFGFKFEAMNIDTMTHLRELLEANSKDPSTVIKELSFLSKDGSLSDLN